MLQHFYRPTDLDSARFFGMRAFRTALVILALKRNGTFNVIDFLGLNSIDIDSLTHPDGRESSQSGSSHKQSIRGLQTLINFNVDWDGTPLPDVSYVLTKECIKTHRFHNAKSLSGEVSTPLSPSKTPATSTTSDSTDPDKALLAIFLKQWRSVEQNHTKCPIIHDNCHFYKWRSRFVPLPQIQHLAPLLEPDFTAPPDPSVRTMYEEKVNHL